MDDDALYAAAIAGDADAISKLEKKADTVGEYGMTILHTESMNGNTERVRFILRQFESKNLLIKLDDQKNTAMYFAVVNGHTEVVELLIDAARYLSHSSANNNPLSSFQDFLRHADIFSETALHKAARTGHTAIAKLLVEADPSDKHIQNYEGKTPIYVAAENGYNDIVKVICTTCTALFLDGPHGSTALHAAMKNLDQAKEKDEDVIRMIIDAAKRSPHVSFEALFNKTDGFGRTILELAVMGNHVNLVDLILKEGPAYQHARPSKTNGLMRLIDHAKNWEYKDIVELLSKTCVTGGYELAAAALILAIKRRDKDSVLRLLRDAKHLATITDDDGWTPLHYAAGFESDSVLDAIAQAQKDSGYRFNYKGAITPLLLAAEKGYTSTVIRLMQLWPASSSAYTATNSNGQNILHLAAAENKKEMIQGILKYCPEKYKDQILTQKDDNGDTPLHLLISHGCFIPELMKHKGLDTKKNKEKWTPQDMLYLEDNIIGDQVKIKIALDRVQTTQSWKFWGKSMERKTDILESSVLPSKREKKDELFNKETKSLMKEERSRMKGLEKYKKRTNPHVMVTSLITPVAFTVGFTMPGGLRQSGEVDEGLVILSKKRAFNAFMVSDALALLLSTSSLFLNFLESMNEDPHQVSKLNAAAIVLNIVSVMAMVLAFIAGTYAVLSHSPALAITVCIIVSLFFLLIIVVFIKTVYDRQVKRYED